MAIFGLVAACVTQGKRDETDLAQLLEWYPGRYSNVEQAEADSRAGHEPHAALELIIVRVYAPLLGDYAFYVQETAADDPRRVITQRVVTFAVVKKHGIVQTLWSPAEPVRWRDAHLNPDLFKSLQSQDFAPLTGCELIWSHKDGRYLAANDPRTCRATSAVVGGPVRMSFRAEISEDGLALAEQSYDVAGNHVRDDAADPFYRFRKR